MHARTGLLGTRAARVLAAVALLAVPGAAAPAGSGEKTASPAGRDPSREALADMETVRRRSLTPLLHPVGEAQVRQLMAALRPDGSWPNVDYKDRHRAAWRTPKHLHNVLLLAQAYEAPGSKLRGDARLRKCILAGLEYWLGSDFKNPNWWWNVIGVPRTMVRILLLLDEELSDQQRRKGAEILKRAKIGMTGQNLVWVAEITALRGILQRDPDLAAKAFSRIAGEIRVTTKEGVQPDWSFHQHGPCLYTHGYGMAFAVDCSRLAALLAGTRFAFRPEKIEILARYVLDGQQWMARGSCFDYGAMGRGITRKGQSGRGLSTVAGNMLRLATGREEEFRALAARAADKPAPPLEGNRHFRRVDMMTHHRKGYYASARMFSRRIVNTDVPCNSEGLRNHHIADGCNFLLRTGGEYAGIFPVWDWQKVPGTTVEQTARLQGKVRAKGARTFVGGVSDGTYGMAAFDFARGKLAARKAWAFFDNEYVCLGAGISCRSGSPVATTLDQRHLAGDVTVSDGQSRRKLDNGTHALNAPAWIHHDRVAYLFPTGGALVVRNDTQKGNWWRINHRYPKDEVAGEVFASWIDHGRDPQNATYAYIVAPDISLSAVPKYAAERDVEVLKNEPDLQAVRHRRLDVTGIAFYQPGRLEVAKGLTIGVDQPCLVLLRAGAGRIAISVANPENKELTVAVEMTRKLQGENVEALSGKPGKGASRVTFRLPGGMDAGKSVTQMRSSLPE